MIGPIGPISPIGLIGDSMSFDWMTWGIFGIGVGILVIWVVIPIREFKGMLKKRREKEKNG